MMNTEMQSAFFEKAIRSIKLSLTLLTEDKVKEHRTSAIGELFHGYELLLKSHIAKHSRYLLVQDTKTLLVDDWKVASFDSLLTKNANELPKLLFALEGAAEKVSFIREQKTLIEKMRLERNRYEHGASEVTPGYISLILGPFFQKVILRLIEFNGKSYKDFFPDSERLELFNSIEFPHKMLGDPNKFLEQPRVCPSCLNQFSFLSKSKDVLHCLVCNKDVLAQAEVFFRKCPCCQGELISYGDTVECLGECRKRYSAEPNIGQGQSCNCGSRKVASIHNEIGGERGLCLQCLEDLESMWQCDICHEFRVNEEKVEPPEELSGNNLCEDCGPEVRAAYEPH